MLPNYTSEELKAYFQMSSEDRRKILDDKYFDTNPLTCIKEYLPYLALEVGVNIDNLDEESARIAIDEAISALNYKGTTKSFKASLKPYTDAEIKEWYEYNGEAYKFKAILSPDNVEFKFDENNYKRLTKIIEENKNVRSVLDGFEFELKLNEEIKTYSGFSAKIKIDKNKEIDLGPTNNIHIPQAKVSYVSINSTLNMDLNINTNNNLQGAVIWQV
ncbi:hypothetical protein JCM11957_06760 [Caminibacter profundus]